MRLAAPALILGLALGYGVHSLIDCRPAVDSQFIPGQTGNGDLPKEVDQLDPKSKRILSYHSREYARSSIVVLGDVIADFPTKTTRVSVIEVWKGPKELAGQDFVIQEPNKDLLFYAFSGKKERALVFLYILKPNTTSRGISFIEGDSLRDSPLLNLGLLRRAFATATDSQDGTRP
jgi:hypothetical protein